MEVALMTVAETLAADFDDLPITTVVRVLTDCVAEHPDADPHFIEQAARALLRAERGIPQQRSGA